MLKDLSPRAVQRQKQPVKRSNRMQSFASYVAETSGRPTTKQANQKTSTEANDSKTVAWKNDTSSSLLTKELHFPAAFS